MLMYYRQNTGPCTWLSKVSSAAENSFLLYSICLLHSEMNSAISLLRDAFHMKVVCTSNRPSTGKYWTLLTDSAQTEIQNGSPLQKLCISLKIGLCIFFPVKNSAGLFCNFNFPQRINKSSISAHKYTI